jgi:monoamine oxidase
MHALLDADLWQGMLAEEVIDWQPTMFQPIGGMDRIPAAFEKKLGSVLRSGAVVRSIRQSASGVTVVYRDRASGTDQTIQADYCICAMPLTIVRTLDADFSPAVRETIDSTSYDSAYKVAWEAPRFWEKENGIYGGLSYLQQTVNVVWYPSARLFSDRGIVVSGYSIENGTAFGKLPDIDAKHAASQGPVKAGLHQLGPDSLQPGIVDQRIRPRRAGLARCSAQSGPSRVLCGRSHEPPRGLARRGSAVGL